MPPVGHLRVDPLGGKAVLVGKAVRRAEHKAGWVQGGVDRSQGGVVGPQGSGALRRAAVSGAPLLLHPGPGGVQGGQEGEGGAGGAKEGGSPTHPGRVKGRRGKEQGGLPRRREGFMGGHYGQVGGREGIIPQKGRWAPWAASTARTAPWAWAIRARVGISDNTP